MSLLNLDYNTPDPAQATAISNIREAGKAFLDVIEANTVNGRLRSVGLTQFELSMMAFNKSIINDGVYPAEEIGSGPD